MAEFVMNSREHSAHKLAPFEVVYGYTPHFNIPVGRRTGIPAVDKRLKILESVRKDVTAALESGKTAQKAAYERGKQTAHQFKVGDKVWLSTEDINLQIPSRKLGDRQMGPFEVVEKIGDLDYKLKLSKQLSRLHPVFHVDKLSPFRGNEVNGLLPPPPPPIQLKDNDEPEYEVEEILNSERKWGSLRYFVRWKDYDGADATSWEPAENVKNAKRLVKEFHRKHPDAVK